MKFINFPIRYVPTKITRKDKQKQLNMLIKSKKLYKKHKYYTRKNISSYKNIKSNHILNARKIYNIQNITPNTELAMKTGCKLSALNQIVKKGEGAYYSSGSRPNQTSQSWGIARLASAITAGKAAAVDYNILEEGCNSKSKALKLAKKAKKKYGQGTKRAPKVEI